MSPTQRTLKALREMGVVADIVERWVQFGPGKGGVRKDFLGIIDVIAICPRRGVVGIQICDGSSFAAHKKKMMESPNAKIWLSSGCDLELWGWRKVKVKRGSKAMVWRPRIGRWKGEKERGSNYE